MKYYTDTQLAILRAKAIEMAQEAILRSGKSDPDGHRVDRLALYFYRRRGEWSALVDLTE